MHTVNTVPSVLLLRRLRGLCMVAGRKPFSPLSFFFFLRFISHSYTLSTYTPIKPAPGQSIRLPTKQHHLHFEQVEDSWRKEIPHVPIDRGITPSSLVMSTETIHQPPAMAKRLLGDHKDHSSTITAMAQSADPSASTTTNLFPTTTAGRGDSVGGPGSANVYYLVVNHPSYPVVL